MITGLDRIYHAHHFILVSHFIFLFIPCGRLSWLPVNFLLHVKYTLSYRIKLQWKTDRKFHESIANQISVMIFVQFDTRKQTFCLREFLFNIS